MIFITALFLWLFLNLLFRKPGTGIGRNTLRADFSILLPGWFAKKH
jgi:hypothetical protein